MTLQFQEQDFETKTVNVVPSVCACFVQLNSANCVSIVSTGPSENISQPSLHIQTDMVFGFGVWDQTWQSYRV